MRHALKNRLAPLATRLAPERGCFGMDGDPEAVLRTMDWLGRALPPGFPGLDGPLLELGPGRTPHLMAGLVLAGSESAVGLDVSPRGPMSMKEPLQAMGHVLRQESATELLALWCSSPARVAERVTSVGPQRVTMVEYEGAEVPLATNSISLVVSKSTLEHVRHAQVAPLLRDLRRVLKPDGIMVHVVDLRDHMWIDGDHEQTGNWLEALELSDRMFHMLFSKRSTYINRLRSSEWRGVLSTAGFEILTWSQTQLSLPTSFDRSRLQPRWGSLSPSDLSVGHIAFAARAA